VPFLTYQVVYQQSALPFMEQNKTNNKNKFMGNLLYTIAVILVIIWAIGFLGFNAGGIIHVLLVIALIVVLLRVIQGKKIV
jgi:tryptophan-rich sensory protein